MTAISTKSETPERRELADWEAPSRLLARYLQTGGMQALGFALCVIGFLVLIFGWWKISQESVVALQIPYLVSGGIGGVLLLGMGGILLVGHDLRLDNRRLEAIEESIAELRDALLVELENSDAPTRVVASGSGPNGAVPHGASPSLVRVSGGSRYHLADCAVTAGKDVSPIDPSEIGGLAPCKLCAPSG